MMHMAERESYEPISIMPEGHGLERIYTTICRVTYL
jgi:hypothetical protein